jgi:hypothetical protein
VRLLSRASVLPTVRPDALFYSFTRPHVQDLCMQQQLDGAIYIYIVCRTTVADVVFFVRLMILAWLDCVSIESRLIVLALRAREVSPCY